MSICLTPARAAASRRNGAKSRGPATQRGKARASKNALKHGLCAERYLVGEEDAAAFSALEAAILDELEPQGVLQKVLAGRIVRAAWRLERSERIEAELFDFRMGGDGDLAIALMRDGNSTRSFDTLMRYRGSALAEFFRALRMLQALQDRDRTIDVPGAPAVPVPQQRNEPKCRGNADEATPGARPAEDAGGQPGGHSSPATSSSLHPQRNEPESRRDPALVRERLEPLAFGRRPTQAGARGGEVREKNHAERS
ncbi:MAG: hypothetical protein AAF637_08610 [Pseudomonadota bacterium]